MFRTLAHWTSLNLSQWFGVEKLRRLQFDRLKKLVAKSYEEVPFYRKKYDRNMVERLKTLGFSAFTELPVISRAEVAGTPLEERTAASVDPKACLRRRTSGSTGEPLVILETKESAAYWTALYLRSLWAYGVRPGNKIVRALPNPSPQSINFFRDKLFTWASSMPVFIDLSTNVQTIVETVLKVKPTVLIIQPSELRRIIDYCEKREAKISVKIIVTTGETLTPSTRKAAEDFFSAEVFDRYSTVELGNIAWECPTHTAYHINVEAVVLELLDGKAVSSNMVEGEAVVTCLYRYATPLIRYRVGDLVKLVDDECPCGRGLPLLKNVEGRRVDCLVKKNGDLISPYTVISRIGEIDSVREFRVVQNSDYSVEITAVPKKEEESECLPDLLKSTLKEIMNGLDVRVKIVENIETKTGPKFKLVESKVAR